MDRRPHPRARARVLTPPAPVTIVTGATSGIGPWIAAGLARAGCRVVLVGRDPARTEAARAFVAAEVPGALLDTELADLASTRATAALGQRLAAAHPEIAVLVNNAGAFLPRRTPTPEGHDTVLAVNHLAPFLLNQALRPALQSAADRNGGARIVTVGSSSSDRARIDPTDLDARKRFGMYRNYAQSKLAVMLATFETARRLAGTGITANVVHPGLVATRIVREGGAIGLAWRLMTPFMRTDRQGAETPIHVALDPSLATTTGLYFKNRHPARTNPLAQDHTLARRIWDETERLLA